MWKKLYNKGFITFNLHIILLGWLVQAIVVGGILSLNGVASNIWKEGNLGTSWYINRRIKQQEGKQISGLSTRQAVLLYQQVIRPMMVYAYCIWGLSLEPMSVSCRRFNPSVCGCYWCKLVHWQQANSRGFVNYNLCQPHPSHNREFVLKVGCRGEPLTSASRKILKLNKGWPMSPEAQAKRDWGYQASRNHP